MATFNEFGLERELLQAISHMGFEETTPIQEQTIPFALLQKDLIGQAQTGTGKTAAYGIPVIAGLKTGDRKIQVLVLSPTRELAIQIAEELNRIGQFKGIRSLPVYGGQDINRQIKALKLKPHIIVATPGRLMDHMRRRTIRLASIQVVVLDEADEMLNMGFIEDIETILQETPKERQTMLFSATMPKPVQLLAKKFMIEPRMFSIKSKEITVPNTEQHYIEVHEKEKFDVLCRLLDIQSPELAIVFGRTKRRVDELNEALNKRGYAVEGIHGDLNQSKRSSVLNKFRRSQIEVLIATDVAARGLDIGGVTHIYNFDIPQDPESYVHRIGRTGRAGNKGLAVTFVTPREMAHLRAIEGMTKRKIDKKPVPTITEAREGQQRLAVEKLLEIVEAGTYKNYKALAGELLAEHDSVTLLSAALKMLVKEPDKTPVKLTEEPPLRSKVKNWGSRGRGIKDRKSKSFNWGKRNKEKQIYNRTINKKRIKKEKNKKQDM